jgi:N-acetyl-anhydromuramyl-L-alanine amidase AmpD
VIPKRRKKVQNLPYKSVPFHYGYPPHQHPNDICPYAQPAVDNDNQGGLTKEEVMAIQTKLTELGYYSQDIDGEYGPGTQKAVKKFQKDHGLAADGICGPKTKTALGLS